MSWFGFGFNGFGQIKPTDVVGGQAKCKVSTPVLISDICGSDCRFSASWCSTAQLNSESHVCVSGFVDGSSGQVCDEIIPESQGCTNVSISERYLTLAFKDKVECWEIRHPQNKLVWKKERGPSDDNADHAVRLPLVPGGYVMPKPPFFSPLSPELCAVSLALGTEHAVLLTGSGTVYTWGSGSHGQLGHSTLTSHEEPQILEALWGVPVREVSAGGWHSASVSAGGDLYMWGWNESGQLGLPSKSLKEEKLKKRTENTQTFEGEEKRKDEVFISIQAFPALVDIPCVSEIVRIGCGSRHTAAITGTGDLYTWGWGQYGQLGHDSENSTDEPKLVEYFHSRNMNVQDVVCGSWNTFVSAVPKKTTDAS